MLQSARYQVSYPNSDRSDRADVPADFGSVVTGLEKSVMYMQGTLAARPLPAIQARIYYATDNQIHYWDTGSAWQTIGTLTVPSGGVGTVNLQDGSVTEPKLATKAVSARAMGDNTISLTGSLAVRPDPTTVSAGTLYFASDSVGGTVYRSDGTTWTPITSGLTAGSKAPVATTISSLNAFYGGAPSDGAVGTIRPTGINSRMNVVYDSGLGKWVSDTRNWAKGSAEASSGTNGDIWSYIVGRSALGFTHLHGAMIQWGIWANAGLAPQFRFIAVASNGSGGANNWFIQPMHQGLNAGAAIAVSGTNLGAQFQGNQTNPTLVGDLTETTWRAITVAVADFIVPSLRLGTTISPANTNSYIWNATILWRWVG